MRATCILIAAAASLGLGACTTLPAPMPPSTPAPAPAADAIFEVRDEVSNKAVLLFDDAGPCLAPARHAEFIGAAGERIPGCWKLIDGDTVVQIAFLDGDGLHVPRRAFRPPKKT